jgi:hypothetical protein
MDLKKFLLSMSLATLLCWFGFFMVLIFISPQEITSLTFLLFYLILGLAVMGTFTIFGFLIRKLFNKNELAFEHVIVSFRQAIWLSLILIISLYLQSRQLLAWWNAILLILGLGLIEFFYLSQKEVNK